MITLVCPGCGFTANVSAVSPLRDVSVSAAVESFKARHPRCPSVEELRLAKERISILEHSWHAATDALEEARKAKAS